LEKYSNIKCHENAPNVSRTVACGRTDGHEAKSRVSEFYDRVSKRRNVTGPLTRKGTGLPEVLDARQTQHRLTPQQSNSEHNIAYLPAARIPASHNTNCAVRLTASAVFSSSCYSPHPSPSFFFFLRNAVKHATLDCLHHPTGYRQIAPGQVTILRDSAALAVSTAVVCRLFEAPVTVLLAWSV
jgi:hypothetical protein